MKKLSKRKIKALLSTLLICALTFAFDVYMMHQKPSTSTSQQMTTDALTHQEAVQIKDYKCVDGDTFWINGEKIRLLAIDAPESTKKIDPYGKEASTFVCNILSNATTVRLEQDKGNEIDKYNRSLYWVFLDDTLIQYKIVRNGFAEIKYVDKKTVNTTYLSILEQAELDAKREKMNIWS